MKKLQLLFLILFISANYSTAADDPVSNKEISGEWQGYILHHGEITFMTRQSYHFLPSGKWSIRENGREAVLQGWYKNDKGTLLLQPLQAAQRKQNAALKALWKSQKSFELSNPVNPDMKMIFIKSDSIGRITADEISGKWEIRQKDLFTKECRTAPFVIHFSKGKYQLEQKNAKLPEEWSSGTFEILENKLFLKNKFKGNGLWNAPVFFLLEGKLKYNNSQYCLWCERIKE